MTLDEFAKAAPETGALFGLDLGAKTIGIAVSDGPPPTVGAHGRAPLPHAPLH